MKASVEQNFQKNLKGFRSDKFIVNSCYSSSLGCTLLVNHNQYSLSVVAPWNRFTLLNDQCSVIKILENNAYSSSVIFLENGNFLSANTNGTIDLWDFRQGTCERVYESNSDLKNIKLLTVEKGILLIATEYQNNLCLKTLDTKSWKVLKEWPFEKDYYYKINATGNLISCVGFYSYELKGTVITTYKFTDGHLNKLYRFCTNSKETVIDAKLLNEFTLLYSTVSELVMHNLMANKTLKKINCFSGIKHFNFISNTEFAVLDKNGLFINSLATYECLSCLEKNEKETDGYHYSIHANKENGTIVLVFDQEVFSYQSKFKRPQSKPKDLFFTNQSKPKATSILLNIPKMKKLLEREGGLDLSQLALNKESPMTALTQGEQSRLEKTIMHYQPILDKEGIGPLLEKLRAQLSTRYERNPASIKDEYEVLITLPLDFISFKKLPLSEKDYEKALKAYYQHRDYTALHYLSNSAFKEYIPLTLIFWLAACDEQLSPMGDMTLEERLTHFIDKLAHLKGDKPSCDSGLKRRLFQSVLSHPLISLLTPDMVLTELKDFVRAYVDSQLTDQNKPLFQEAFNEYIQTTELSEASKAQLALLNIPPSKQQEFTYYLVNKYGDQYSENASLRAIVENKLRLTPTKELITSYHALSLDGFAGIYRLFLPEAKASQIGLYSQTNSLKSNEEENKKKVQTNKPFSS
jgi:hypothetical protein